MDDDTARVIEREVQRVTSNEDLERVTAQLAKYIKTPEDYERLIENGIRGNLSGARGLGMNMKTPQDAVNSYKFLKGYVERFVEVMSEKMGHPEYIPRGKIVANKVLEEFAENFKPKI